MESLHLKQTRLLVRKNFELSDNCLKIREKSFSHGEKEWTVRLDEISLRTAVVPASKAPYVLYMLIAAVFVGILGMGFDLWMWFSWILLIIGFHMWMTYLFISNTILVINSKFGPISFLRKNPSKDGVDHFINELFSRSKTYLKWKYGTIDKDFSKSVQIKNFRWLRNMEIISDQEYERLKIELDKAIVASQQQPTHSQTDEPGQR